MGGFKNIYHMKTRTDHYTSTGLMKSGILNHNNYLPLSVLVFF